MDERGIGDEYGAEDRKDAEDRNVTEDDEAEDDSEDDIAGCWIILTRQKCVDFEIVSYGFEVFCILGYLGRI